MRAQTNLPALPTDPGPFFKLAPGSCPSCNRHESCPPDGHCPDCGNRYRDLLFIAVAGDFRSRDEWEQSRAAP